MSKMEVDFAIVALRQNAILIRESELRGQSAGSESNSGQESTLKLAAELAKLGFGLDEELFHALSQTSDQFRDDLLVKFRSVMGLDQNWTPLVKGWLVPTGETLADYFYTTVSNLFGAEGTEMPCGHIIPDGTFPLERYNGCPYCKTPFEFGEVEHTGQGSALKVLNLWAETDLQKYFEDLLLSRTPLDATQISSLKFLLAQFELPSPLTIGMKETLALVVDSLVEMDRDDDAAKCFRSPTDIMRYLWYKKTGFLQLVMPKVIVAKKLRNNIYRRLTPTQIEEKASKAKQEAATKLKLKYTRSECRRVAKWLNGLDLDAEAIAEQMHSKRGMWVRFIRALRLAEYGKRPEFAKLRQLLDLFYNQRYEVWLGQVNGSRLNRDVDSTMALLKKRPGFFARSLFADMLWFGNAPVLQAFQQIADEVPARLLMTLAMYSELYFDPATIRYVKPLGNDGKQIPANPLLKNYSDAQRTEMIEQVQALVLDQMKKRFARDAKLDGSSSDSTMYIDPVLFKMPLPIGDRSESVQSLPVSLMGTRFPIEGDTVRLFMFWGKGLPKQHLDMDLSCFVSYDDKTDYCSFAQLTVSGCQHSGDIIHIPEQVGTAEYIELDLAELRKNKARYVAFTCNAYSRGELSLDMSVGWMNSKNPMTVSDETGVAYDPSCVQHQIQITQTLSKGLVFGVLDVQANEIVWLEMPFGGQVVQGLKLSIVQSLLKRLDSKMSIGQLLAIKAEAQNFQVVSELDPNQPADEVYELSWARNSAAVTQLLVD